jgi:hypothetical protein
MRSIAGVILLLAGTVVLYTSLTGQIWVAEGSSPEDAAAVGCVAAATLFILGFVYLVNDAIHRHRARRGRRASNSSQ